MAFIPEEKISEIRDRASIVSVLSQYVHLKKTGVNHKACCPFHAEKTASFVVSEAKGIYHCFGCGKGGNVFTFLIEHAGLSFPEAVRKLANDLGVLLPEIKYTKAQKQIKEKKLHYYQLNNAALRFFKTNLQKNKKAQQFLKSRGLSQDIIERYHLGYAPDSWQGLTDAFRSQRVDMNDVKALGLIVSKEGSNRFYDRFRDRVIFPLFDLNQRVVGFGGRGLSSDTQPKYLNSSDSPIYHKGKELYGLSHITRKSGTLQSAAFKSGVIVVEGYFDCLLLLQAGFKSVVATMGTALTQEHIDRLKRFTDRFYLLFDGDEAGKNAMERSFPIFMRSGLMPKVVLLADKQDPDDFIRSNSAKALVKKIKSSMPLLDFVISRLISRQGRTAKAKAKIIEDLAPHLTLMPEGIEQEEMIKKVSDMLGVDEKWVTKPMKATSEGAKSVDTNWKADMQRENVSIELELLEFFMLFPGWLAEAKAQKILDLFSDLEVKTIVLDLLTRFEGSSKVDVPLVLEKIESSSLKKMLNRGLIQKESQNWDQEKWRPVYKGAVRKLKQKHLGSLEKDLLRQIRACEKNSNNDAQKVELLNRYQEIVKQKQLLVNSAI